jgi:hypothetical protein
VAVVFLCIGKCNPSRAETCIFNLPPTSANAFLATLPFWGSTLLSRQFPLPNVWQYSALLHPHLLPALHRIFPAYRALRFL